MDIKLKEYKSDLDKKEILLILDTDYIHSTNNLYSAKIAYKTKGGKKSAYPMIFKNPEVVAYCQRIEEELLTIDFKKEAPWIWETKYFNLTVQFVVKQSFGRRDTDNMLKSMQDSVFRHLGLNDSRIVELHAYKSFLPEAKNEYIKIRLSESTHDFMFK